MGDDDTGDDDTAAACVPAMAIAVPADCPTIQEAIDAVLPHVLDTVSTDPLEWDLHLMTLSSLVDAGDPTLLDPDGSPSDIGAYGGVGAQTWDLDGDGYPEWWQPGDYDFAAYPAQGWDCDDSDETVFPDGGC